MEDIMKMVKSEEFVLLLKGASKTIENEKKIKKGFLGILLGTLGANLLGYLLVGKCVIQTGEGTIRVEATTMS